MAEPISVDALIEQAHKDTGIDAFDAETYREGLEVFVIAKERRNDHEPRWARLAVTAERFAAAARISDDGRAEQEQEIALPEREAHREAQKDRPRDGERIRGSKCPEKRFHQRTDTVTGAGEG